MLKVPEEWNMLLAELHNREITAVIAGGAVRDYYCGRKPKDIDFFCFNQDLSHHSGFKLKSFANVSTYNWEMLSDAHEYNAGEKDPQDRQFIMYAYEIKRTTGFIFKKELTPLNLIFCEKWPSIHDLISSFDFGICQAAYDGKQFHTTEAFLRDWRRAEFTMMHGKRWEKSTERYQRISQRYSGWPMKLSGRAWLDKVLKKLEEAGKFVDNAQEITF